MIIKKLASQTAIYGMSTILVKFINYLLTPYLTYILSESEYGIQSYFYAFIPFGLTILTMGLETGYFRFAGKAKTPKEERALFSTIFSVVALAGLLFFGLSIAFTNSIYHFLVSQGADLKAAIPLVGALIAVDAIVSVAYARLRAKEKSKKFVITRVLSVVINVSLCLFFYSVLPHFKESAALGWMWIEGFGVGYIFVSNLVASLLTLLLVLSDIKDYRPHIDRKLLWGLIIFSAPLLLSGLSGTANEFIDRQMLAYLLPMDIKMSSVGIYSGVMKLAALMYLFIQMYRYAAEPLFLTNIKKEDFKAANAEAMKYFVIVSIIIFLFITLFLDIFQYFIGRDFRQGLRIVPILLLSNMFIGIYVNLSFWYKITEKTIFAVVISIAGLVVTVALNLVLIPKMGYEGSALARLGCEGSMVVLSYVLNQKYYPINYDLKTIGIYALVGAAIYALSIFINIDNTTLSLSVNAILFAIFILFFIRKEHIDVRAIITKLKRKL